MNLFGCRKQIFLIIKVKHYSLADSLNIDISLTLITRLTIRVNLRLKSKENISMKVTITILKFITSSDLIRTVTDS